MCRLLSLSSNRNLTRASNVIFTQMAILSERSGNNQGFGCFTNHKWWKAGAASSAAIRNSEYKEWLEDIGTTKFLCGHTRLPSAQYRGVKTTKEGYPAKHAHPFMVKRSNQGSILVAHNGIFTEWEDHNELKAETDSQAFANMLGSVIGDNQLKPEHIVESLEAMGTAEYSLIITDSSNDDYFYLVRGGRDVYKAESTYGLLLNTDKANLADLDSNLDYILDILGMKKLKLSTPTLLPSWKIYKVEGAKIEEVCDISSIKNEPTVTRTTTYGTTYNTGVTTHGVKARIIQACDLNFDDLSEIADGYEALLSVLEEVPVNVTDKDITALMRDAYGTYDDWWEFSPDKIVQISELLPWVWENYPEMAPSEEKQRLWSIIMGELRRLKKDSTAWNIYNACNLASDDNFYPPWFHNSVETLQALANAAPTWL